MKKLFLIPILFLTACGNFAPDEYVINGTLKEQLKNILELAIQSEMCDKVIEQGFDCNVPDQVKQITFTWVLDNNEEVTDYAISFCPNGACPRSER